MLIGKVALVTGSTKGIGKAIVNEFSKQGDGIIINYFGTVDVAGRS